MDKNFQPLDDQARGTVKTYELVTTFEEYDEFYLGNTPVVVLDKNNKKAVVMLDIIPIMNLPEELQQTCRDAFKAHQLVDFGNIDENYVIVI